MEQTGEKNRLSDTIEKRDPVKFKNGVIYHGEWRGNIRWGYGVQVWPDGAKYEGDWVNGKANGKGTFRIMQENLYMLMGMSTKGIGRTIRLVDMERISISMELSTKENGLMISSMGKEWRLGSMEADMKVTTRRVRKMEKGSIRGEMAVTSSVLGGTTK